MHRRTPPPTCPKLTYTLQPGVFSILSDNVNRSLAELTRIGYTRIKAEHPAEYARCSNAGHVAVILNEATVEIQPSDEGSLTIITPAEAL